MLLPFIQTLSTKIHIYGIIGTHIAAGQKSLLTHIKKNKVTIVSENKKTPTLQAEVYYLVVYNCVMGE